MLLPVLVRPRLLSFKSKWRASVQVKSERGRDIIVLLLSAIVMFSIHRGITTTLAGLHKFAGLVYIHPSILLTGALTLLFFMLLFTNGVAALGALYLS